MLSYRHAFHAGNHADILKHLVLSLCLDHLNLKDKPYFVLDTHAGAGRYSLDSGHALKTREHEDGISRIWDRQDTPAPMASYLAALHACNPASRLSCYPGSPWLIAHLCRKQDQLRFCELHPTDFEQLRRTVDGMDRRITLDKADGYDVVKASLPPPSRRGLVLIDPSYEVKSDYSRLIITLNEGVKRFATGTYLAWLPFIPTIEARNLPARLMKHHGNWLLAGLSVRRPATQGHGMHGSAMFVINPPWTLRAALADALPWLASALALDDRADWQLLSPAPSDAQESSSARARK